MAHLNGRKWLGIDISEKYCGIARKRMEIAENLRSEGYKNRYETMTITSRDTITSDGKLSHKEISDMKKPQLFDLVMKWNDELIELRKFKKSLETSNAAKNSKPILRLPNENNEFCPEIPKGNKILLRFC